MLKRLAGWAARNSWVSWLAVAALGMVFGFMILRACRLRADSPLPETNEDWAFVVADLVDSNDRLRDEIANVQAQLDELEDVEGGGALLQVLVAQVNRLRIANGQVPVSGEGVEVTVSGAISVLDLHDLINELRNAGAEALALNGCRLVAWSAIGTDGQVVTVDNQPVEAPYHLLAIGDPHTLEAALARPGGLAALLHQARQDARITINVREELTLPVYRQVFEFGYAKPSE